MSSLNVPSMIGWMTVASLLLLGTSRFSHAQSVLEGTVTVTANVLATPANSGSGSSGGGGGGGFSTPKSTLNFQGRAYPNSYVTLLRDAQIVATTHVGADGVFQVSLPNLSAGTSIYAFYSEDLYGIRSALYTFPVVLTLTPVNMQLSGIFIAPTITVDKPQVKQGEDIALFGQTAPEANVTISISSPQEYFEVAQSDKDGAYLYYFDTARLGFGEHSAKSKAVLGDGSDASGYGTVVHFQVADRTVVTNPAPPSPGGPKRLVGDLNEDGHVNIVDFSIGAYWYKRAGLPTKLDLNADGKFDLTDFSIMVFNWTG